LIKEPTSLACLFVSVTTMNTSGDSFELEPVSSGEKDTTVKWSVGNTKYEIPIPVLKQYELGHIVNHCMLVKHKIKQDRYLLFIRVFPRTRACPSGTTS
jgi:hypothetical protein